MMTTTSTQTGIETRGVFKRLFERVSCNRRLNTVRPQPVEGLFAKPLNSLGSNGVPAIDRSGLLIRTGLVLLIAAAAIAVRPALADATANPLDLLRQGSMPEREQAVEQLAADSANLKLLQALQEGKLFELKTEAKLVIGQEHDSGYSLTDPTSGASLGDAERGAVGKINLNNKLRALLRKAIGQLQLNHADPAVRLGAVQAMAKNVDDKALALLKDHLDHEDDADIQAAIHTVLLLQDINSPDKSQRVNAITTLKEFDSQDAVNKLQALTEKDADGNFVEADSDIRNLAEAALIKIRGRMQAYAAIETVFFGLSLGAVLVLAAIGLAITFGVMGIINMAHGELMMLGAYTTYVMQQIMPNNLGTALILSIPMAFLVAALVGIAIERGIIRFLYGRPLETLLATFGVSLFLQQAVRSIFSPLNRSVSTPEWMSGSWQINDFLSLTWNRFYILIFCLLVFTALLQILKRTKLGLEVRAVAQNRGMARAMGIPTSRVDAMTFGLGSGIAGVAGVALSQITNVGPNLGQAYIVDSFMVVVFGGVGNLFGTLVAGFSLGIANKVLEPYAGAVLAKILVLVFIILFIQKKPRGLFPQKGRAAES
ncbi:urea ABC transporter permease subunit UrtB [Methylomonas koyamae]|uniref:urea ABC transporter permease subunit UrtB n=1 Tax=Methylomonas koyamae TaxID=702114 RepID=UPI001E3363F1|nr:urea ABC transporter permease subunit UrtB [Methylomonas koyamae]